MDEIERVKKGGRDRQRSGFRDCANPGQRGLRTRWIFRDREPLTEYIAAGDWTLYVTEDDALKKVTAADVKRVANTYFQENKRTTGWFIPLPGEAPESDDKTEAEGGHE